MGKQKKEKKEDQEKDTDMVQVDTTDKELLYEEKLKFVNAIAKPMASRKQAKKLYKLIKKASKHKTYLKTGLKLVQGALRKGERGIVIFAGDVTPIEIMCHLPAVCEEKQLSYMYIPSRDDLGTAIGTRKGAVVTLIKEHQDYKDLYDECVSEIDKIPLPI
uniref:Putative NHP2 protein n=1 Tax=Xibalbanus tulumensis TaxID=1519145 RepID=A0A481SY67_XIBTU|nr:putative NHP2 protein [Xibalbanus tulumensis]